MQLINRARLVVPAALLIATSVLAPTGAFAHEHRDSSDGKYTLVVGWQSEPPYQGQANAATIRISLADTDPAQPVEGAEQSLRLQLRSADMTMDLPLHAVAGKPGSYAADIVPDMVGDVQWSFSGSINGDQVDEIFDTADGKFDAVKPAEMAESPMPVAAAVAGVDVSQLSATVDMLDKGGLHDLDMALQDGSAPASDALGRVHQIDVAFGAVVWPEALRESATQLSSQLDLLHEALEANDMHAAMDSAHEAHMLSHAFSSQARAWLAAQPGPSTATMPAMDMHGHDSMPDMSGD
jgi:hypothetical protein